MLTQIINGRILTPQGWLKDGSVLICDGKILEVTNSDLAVIGATVIDARGMTIVPGFVSMHAHGGGGEIAVPNVERYEKKYRLQRFKLDSGIEIAIPMDIYQDRSKVEFVNNPDGTMSLVIKDIESIVNKFTS